MWGGRKRNALQGHSPSYKPISVLGGLKVTTKWKKSDEGDLDQGLEWDTPLPTLSELSPLFKMMEQRPENVVFPYAQKENKLDLVNTWDCHWGPLIWSFISQMGEQKAWDWVIFSKSHGGLVTGQELWFPTSWHHCLWGEKGAEGRRQRDPYEEPWRGDRMPRLLLLALSSAQLVTHVPQFPRL